MLSKLREQITPFRRLLAWPFLTLGAKPATVGAVGIGFAAGAAILARSGCYSAAFWATALAFATDIADGEVARQTNTCTPEGNYLDAVGDRVSECLLLLGLLPSAPNLTALALTGACLTSFAKARCALVRTLDNHDWPGLGDYPDRALIILIGYLCLPDPSWPLAALGVITWSCLWQRVRYARRLIQEANRDELQPYLRGSERNHR